MNTPTFTHLFGRKKKGATIQPKTTAKPQAGRVLPFRQPAPKPEPQQRPAPSRKAAELPAGVQAAVERERRRCHAIAYRTAKLGVPALAAALIESGRSAKEARAIAEAVSSGTWPNMEKYLRESSTTSGGTAA